MVMVNELFECERVEVGGEDFYLDLLFYHLRLRCYVVIELKAGGFKPELPGKTYMNDMRFSKPGNDLHVNYDVNDGQWLTDAEVKRLPEFAVAVGQANSKAFATTRPGNRLSRPVVWAVFAALAALPVVVFFKQRRKGGL